MNLTAGNPDVAQQKLARLLQFLSSDPDNQSLRADVYDTALACGALEEAQFQLTHALRLQPDHPAWLNRQALLLIRQHRPGEAQVVLEQLLAGGHQDAGIRFNLAYAQFAQGAMAAALATSAPLREAGADIASLAWALWLRCRHHLGQLREGLQAFADAAGAASKSADCWGVASLMAFDANQLAEAKDWAARALNARPDQQEALVTAGSLALGEQDAMAAREAFLRSLQINPEDGRSWSGVAFAAMLQRDFSGAHTAFVKAVEAMPEHIGTWIGLGWCEFASKHAEAARSAFQQALALDPNFAESHGGLAVALVQLGQPVQAQVEIEVALRLDVRSLSARYAQAMLSGETDDPVKFLRYSRRMLAQHPAPGSSDGAQTLADVILRHHN